MRLPAGSYVTPLPAHWPAAQWFSSHGLMRHVKHNKTAPDAAMGLKTHRYHDAELEIVFGEEIERRASDAKLILGNGQQKRRTSRDALEAYVTNQSHKINILALLSLQMSSNCMSYPHLPLHEN
jgi:hypothetical protein